MYSVCVGKAIQHNSWEVLFPLISRRRVLKIAVKMQASFVALILAGLVIAASAHG